MRRKLLIGIILGLFIILVITHIVHAVTWTFSFPVTVTDTSNVTRTYYPVTLNATGQQYINAGYINTDGLNTNMQIGSTSIPYMLSTTKVLTVVPTLTGGGRAIATFYTGYSPQQTSFPIITGDGGYVTTNDTAALEPGSDFSITINGYMDTANATAGTKRLIYKGSTLDVSISPTVSGNITVTSDYGTYPLIYSTSNGTALATTNSAVTMPSGTLNGDLLMVMIGTYNVVGSPTLTSPAGWTQLYQTPYSPGGGIFMTQSVWYKISAGSEPATANWTLTVASTFHYSAVRIPAGSFFGVPVSNANATTATSINADPPSLTTGFGAVPTLWFAVASVNTAVTADPAGFTAIPDVNGTYMRAAWLQATVDPENPGAFTNVNSQWEANTIGIRYGNGVNFSAAGITTGVHTFSITENTTSLGIVVDNVTLNTVSSLPILDSANNWVFGTGNFMPYYNYLKIVTGGVERLWYQPNTMVQGTVLPDRDSTKNGDITYGTNTNITLHAGTMVSNNSTSSTGSNATVGFTMPTVSLPNNWFGGGSTITLPFYDEFSAVSSSSGVSTQMIYFIIAIAFAFLAMLLVMRFTRSNLLGIIVFNSILFMGTSNNVVPMWVAFSTTLVQFGILYLSRQV